MGFDFVKRVRKARVVIVHHTKIISAPNSKVIIIIKSLARLGAKFYKSYFCPLCSDI